MLLAPLAALWAAAEANIGEIRERTHMPTISMFYGILIRIFFYDTDKHSVPHIHAEFQGDVGVYSIPDGEQQQQLQRCLQFLSTRYPEHEILGLWVNETWTISELVPGRKANKK